MEGNAFQYQLVDGLGFPINQAGIQITETIAGNGPTYSTVTVTGAPITPGLPNPVPANGPGEITDIVGYGIPGVFPDFTSFNSLSTTQTFSAEWQGQSIALTTVNNQQTVTILGYTESCVTPVGQ